MGDLWSPGCFLPLLVLLLSFLFSLTQVLLMGEEASSCLITASATECRLSAERVFFLRHSPLGAMDGAFRPLTFISFPISSAGRYPTHRLCSHPRTHPTLPWGPT